MKAPPFLFIRHGETDWNREGRLQGTRDIPLNDTGRAQADEAGRRAAALLRAGGDTDPSVANLVVSPLARARETADRVQRAMGRTDGAYGLEPLLREFSFGAWEGSTWREVKAREPALVRDRRRDLWRFVPPGGGESYADLAARLEPWLAGVSEPMVVVSHGGVARALMVLVGGVSLLAAPHVEILQGRVLRFAEGRHSWH